MPLPPIFPPREDLVFEATPNLDGTGAFTTPWMDSAGTFSIRIVAHFLGDPAYPGNISVQEAQLDSGGSATTVRTQTVPVTAYFGAGEVDLTARYYRVTFNNGDPAGGSCVVTIRKAERP